ncbi:hypothetical protein M409DRAFT_65201 [Zasmidium cellare ATCC 36951]|uniref:FAD/NAD(P)-binding domain-containing protein n=1 Tax=Zasmidium cellare ATCC 36951 TaxID=1080233 RepID=A0A6A6CNY6_ZASCE|nr:uncharacterized protein M409DRAFT_65201 [Zasmidium cellare ATCC 36951]KAF2168815.1 hypothetical protein M409DRAFT_65201 [Zasmidium cellare ATCC 36951]
MSKTIVILGAGLTGLPLAHYILKHYADKFDLKVILLSRSNEFYWNIAAPRAVIPNQLDDEKVLCSIPEAFANYPPRRFEFIVGTAEGWEPDKKSVTVVLDDGNRRDVRYDTIIVATGSDYNDNMPWKLVGNQQETRAALAKMRTDIAKAKSIVVAGGGPTGVELAGELGYEYATTGKKKVTLVMTENQPLDCRLMTSTRLATREELERLNSSIDEKGGYALELTHNDGTKEALHTDLFLPTWGIRYNTSFAPPSLLEPNGRLKVTNTLRSPNYDNVFLVGDAANLDSYAARVVPEYLAEDKVTMTVAVGRERGVGQLGNLGLWSLLIWWFKSRHMCTNIVPDYVKGKTLILGAF